MLLTSAIHPDQIPGEHFLIHCLQKNVSFTLNNKILKRGRLLLFKRFHYFVQIALLSEKGIKENFDVPIPFKIEDYVEEGLMYFDYRLKSLEVETLPIITEKISSIYFDKILEIQVINTCKLVCL
jgi:hypothetical protein